MNREPSKKEKIGGRSELKVCRWKLENNRAPTIASRGMTRTECSNFVQYRWNTGRFGNADQHFPGCLPCLATPPSPFP